MRVIGRETKKIINGNQLLLNRVKNILQAHIEQAADSRFIRFMMSGNETVAGKVKLLVKMLTGISQ